MDLDPAHQEVLNLPSPYHDDVDELPTSRSAHRDSPWSRWKERNPLVTLFKSLRFRYLRLPSTDAEQASKEEEDDDDDDSATPNSDTRPPAWNPYEETTFDRWFSVLILLFLLSLLINFFLLFNGPPNRIPHHHPNSRSHPLPHKGFHFSEHGRNYTCYQTHTTILQPNYEFSNIFGAYDYFWAELQGKSHGVVYTSLGRADGKTRKAGLAMFHQLDCLAKLRSVVQALQEGRPHALVDVGEHHGYWPHCWDYLRQVILCNADDSLEVGEVEDGRWVTKGFGSARVCRESSWLFEVTGCGEGGCPGKAFYHEKGEMEKIHAEEQREVEEWAKAHPSGT
ncbi:uncharacterized protein EI97DRAFT_431963 [Westerdykella ornata]|uniref:Uncharacterized protein n=1 Tax=Westerdykella ornata TaxID=318751 RepID=A0A6A6JSC9_WESOR|nr:uncharacterized protein EI97DRAFT_431963 [Westerdykella ornata]KAF2277879.1 hypothetical protein EI97DRAFT_431963 [Westerdykella ornata]